MQLTLPSLSLSIVEVPKIHPEGKITTLFAVGNRAAKSTASWYQWQVTEGGVYLSGKPKSLPSDPSLV